MLNVPYNPHLNRPLNVKCQPQTPASSWSASYKTGEIAQNPALIHDTRSGMHTGPYTWIIVTILVNVVVLVILAILITVCTFVMNMINRQGHPPSSLS